MFCSALVLAWGATDAVIVHRSGASVAQDPAPTEPAPENTQGEFPKENRGDLGAPPDSSLLPPGAEADPGLGPAPGEDETEPDSTAAAAEPDSGAALLQTPAAADSGAPMDTLRMTTPASGAGSSAGRPSTPAPAAVPQPRTGVLGLHPVAILLGLAVMQYFIVKAATD